MFDLDLILETIVTIILTIYFLLEGIVRAVLPTKYLPKKDISQDTVLVTGAGSGIGRSLAIALAKMGCQLILWDINEQGNEETADEIRELGGKVSTYTVDLSRREQIYATAEKVKKDGENVSILVNNAGIVTGKKFLQCPDGLIEKSMDVNVMAHFWMTKVFLPEMLERDHGHIVNIASSAGLVGVNGLADYCASKFAAVGFLESLNLELKSMHKSIDTTIVCPYFVNTGLFDGVQTRFPWLLPILETDFVVGKIVEAIQTNQTALYIPRILYLLIGLKGFLPVKAGILLHRFFGTTSSMDQFTGRSPLKSD